MGESRSGYVVPLRRGSERQMMNSIAETEVRDWFRLASPKSWQLPGDADVRDIAELLNLYLDQPTDQLDARGPLDRWRNVKAGVCILSTEIPALLSLTRIEKHDAENLRHVAKHHAGNRHPPARHVQSVDDTAEAEHREQVAKPVLGETRANHDEDIGGQRERLNRTGAQGARLEFASTNTGASR